PPGSRSTPEVRTRRPDRRPDGWLLRRPAAILRRGDACTGPTPASSALRRRPAPGGPPSALPPPRNSVVPFPGGTWRGGDVLRRSGRLLPGPDGVRPPPWPSASAPSEAARGAGLAS